MKLYYFVPALCFGASSIWAAPTVSPLLGGGEGSTLNRASVGDRPALHRQTARSQAKPDVVVFVGDNVFPQFVDGAGWSTSLYLVNLENHPISFTVYFFRDDGTDLVVPISGYGPLRGMHVSLDVAGCAEFETTGLSRRLSQGWAFISNPNLESIGAMGIFRFETIGIPAQEAVVPITNQFDDHFVLMYDNTSTYVTGIAIANPTSDSVLIPVNIRDEYGTIIDTQITALGPFGHTAFVLGPTWPSTAGSMGAIEFLTTGFGVAALGLRFNGYAFTSFPVFENFNWVVPGP